MRVTSLALVFLQVIFATAEALAGPPFYVVYVTEPRLSEILSPYSPRHERCAPAFGACLVAQSKNAAGRSNSDSKSAVDETGNRFNCKNAYWYDLTCSAQPQNRAPASEDKATVLVDVSQSMRNYDAPKANTCQRARLVKTLQQSGLPVRVFGHAEELKNEIDLKTTNETNLTAQACQMVGDNITNRVLDQAFMRHGSSRRPLIMVTDASEQTPHLTRYLRTRGGREIFISPTELAERVLRLLR